MGRHSSDHSESPVRNHRSSCRSPSRRERSPAQRRSSYSARSPGSEKPSRRAKSPITYSPVREQPSSHIRSSKHMRSRSPLDRLPVKETPSSRPRSPVRAHSRSSGSISPSPRSKRSRRDRSNHKDDRSGERGHDKNHGKTRSLARPKSGSPESRSPSPRTRRLRRVQADITSDRGRERNHSGGDRATHKERDPESEALERRDKSGRDAADNNGSSKSRHVSSTSHAKHHRSRHRSRSPPSTGGRDEGNNSKDGDHRHYIRVIRNDNDDSVARMRAAEEALETKEKQKPSFELSGKLAAETNRVKGVTLLFTEPPDARKPEIRWRLYVFKGGEVLNEPLYVHRQTFYLFGRERRVADIPTDHPSCSKQHAVLQYRKVEKEQPDGMLKKEVRPYIMDLGSTNGTFINDNRIEPERYYELMEKDTIKFGNSSREYVLLHENSAG